MSTTIIAARPYNISDRRPVVVTAGEERCRLEASCACADKLPELMLKRLTRCDISAVRDPAVQINYAIAAARLGDETMPRRKLPPQRPAMRNVSSWKPWLASGWTLAYLARRGIALLDEGAFDKVDALAVR